ncbi:putative methyltransferase NSUN7 [Macrosteles quadrilineatus]|uniref:putative methyltransferase NSUN7 n=1 Tax=Macrosteles quadrilineatus TaxID=74068 RepID=UPI0023E33B5E|nr:putative methyltransferase NSUN7 [Macrosteles quadrilineatus]
MLLQFPRLLKDAASILRQVSEEDRSVKDLLYNDKKFQFSNIKKLYAIVIKALQNWDVIESLIKESNILIEHHRLDIWRVRIAISELLFGETSLLNSDNNTIQTVIQNEERLKQILSKKQANASLGNNSDEISHAKVRFVKINLIKDNVNSVIEKFQEDGWEKLKPANSYEDYLDQLRSLEPNSAGFIQDFHLPEVLAFPPGTEFQDYELYCNGSIILMDKASCLAPLLLSPQRDSHVLDMCAAPGLKTIQLASYSSSGKVYAVERDEKRYYSLEKMIEHSGADNVTTILKDVTQLDVDKYKHVEYILVDPSCTGSGVRLRQPSTNLKARLDEKTRLEKLAGFQIKLLRFALTRFPAAKRVVYSTCSLNVEENENVVQEVLQSCNDNFEVVSARKQLPGWKNFGSKEFQFGDKCICCQPEVDQTNGFFITVFERRKNHVDVNTFRSDKVENTFRGEKRKGFEEKSGYKYDSINAPSPKKSKVEHSQEKINEGDKAILNTGNSEEAKLKVKKMSVSEKKRARKKMLKIKKKVIKPKNKQTTIKSKNDKSSSKENTNKINSIQNSANSNSHCDSKSTIKVSKAKLRHKRAKLMKMKSKSGENCSDDKDLSIFSRTKGLNKLGEVDKTKVTEKNDMNKNKNEMTENTASQKNTKEKVKKETPEISGHRSSDNKLNLADVYVNNVKGGFEKDSTSNKRQKHSKAVIDVVTPEIQKSQDTQSHKEKSKKTQSLNYEDEKTFCGISDKPSFQAGCKKIVDISSAIDENNEIEFSKKKRKKKHSLENVDGKVSSYDVCIVEPNKKIRDEKCVESNENFEERRPKKKHKKKYTKENSDLSQVSHIVEDNFRAETRQESTEGVSIENEESAEKRKRGKKHKKKKLLDINGDCGMIEICNDLIEVCNDRTSAKKSGETYGELNESSENRKHKKKHKTKLSANTYDDALADYI